MLIIGSGAAGQLPVTPEVLEEAERRGVEVVIEPTADACHRLEASDPATVGAILHVTC